LQALEVFQELRLEGGPVRVASVSQELIAGDAAVARVFDHRANGIPEGVRQRRGGFGDVTFAEKVIDLAYARDDGCAIEVGRCAEPCR
jgi:hypothetical protein